MLRGVRFAAFIDMRKYLYLPLVFFGLLRFTLLVSWYFRAAAHWLLVVRSTPLKMTIEFLPLSLWVFMRPAYPTLPVWLALTWCTLLM
jgi:hypothetical protein